VLRSEPQLFCSQVKQVEDAPACADRHELPDPPPLLLLEQAKAASVSAAVPSSHIPLVQLVVFIARV
jgi:hypothetical protein